MRDLIGRTLGHYRIVEKIGEGGMGEVYRAHDERLDRDVAVKVLPASVAQDQERIARFEREAKAVAKLEHPNILAIHDFGTEDDVTYAVMELLEGESLRELIARGRLTPATAVIYAQAIADGLAAAHNKGIIHRDLKPENVFLTKDSRIKILDFGLAKLKQPEADLATESPTETLDTMPGKLLGTIAYMAPEQLQGKAADHRSDIFAFGVVLYEMLTVRRPFGGLTTAEVAAEIIKADPAPIAESVPQTLDAVVSKCLEKRPEDRFSSAHDLSLILGSIDSKAISLSPRDRTFLKRRWPYLAAIVLGTIIAIVFLLPPGSLFDRPVEEPAEATVPRIVVLPFENLGSPDDEYFADGITEEIISRLAAVSGLQVISRTSATYYKDRRVAVRQIGDELDVGYVLEGTIRWDRSEGGHGRVRITPQLIRVADDSHLWSERYDRVLEDIFTVQSDIAKEVIDRLQATLFDTERPMVEARPTDNMEAYQAYLLGHQYYWSSTNEKYVRLAVDMLERAVELDPGFAVAYAALSEANGLLYHFGYDFTLERLEKARAAAERSLALQPSLPQGHRALANYYYFGSRDYDQALVHLSIAAEQMPNDRDVLITYFAIYRRQGRWDEALEALERWVAVDPQGYLAAYESANTYIQLREFEKANQQTQRAIAIAPDRPDAYFIGIRNFVRWDGNTDRARRLLESAPSLESANFKWQEILLDIYDRRPELILARLEEETIDTILQVKYVPRELLECRCRFQMDQDPRYIEACGSAVERLQREIGVRPDDYRLYNSLGHALAYLGRSQEAVAASKHATELVPISRDAIAGPSYAIELAGVYSRVGEAEKALDLIEDLLSMPSYLSVGLLRLDPVWDPLRDHPRFQALLEKYDTN